MRSIGEPVTEANLVLQTLHGLNANYNMFVNIENSESQPRFAQLRSRLLMYEERVNQQSKTVPISAMSALKFGDPPPHNVMKDNNTNISCQICRKQGHSADKCYFRYDSLDGGRGRGNVGVDRRNNGGNRGRDGYGRGWRGRSIFRGNRGGRHSGNRSYNNFDQNGNTSGYFIGTEPGLLFRP